MKVLKVVKMMREQTGLGSWNYKKVKKAIQEKAFELAPATLRRSMMLDRLMPEENSEIHTLFAKTEAEHWEAYKLIHDSYVRCGYIHPAESGIRVRPHDLLPETATILSVHDGQVRGTLSVVNDSALKLPIDEAFSDEIEVLRKQGRKVAEVTGLAIAPKYRGGGMMLAMTRYMLAHALRTGVDSLIVAVSPGHAAFYRDVLLFEVMGPARSYSSKIEDIVFGMHLDLRSLRERIRKVYRGMPTRLNLYEFYCGRHDIMKIKDRGYGSTEEGGKAQDFLDYFIYGPGRMCDSTTPDEIAFIQEANHSYRPVGEVKPKEVKKKSALVETRVYSPCRAMS